jgi:hypothetical protein
MFWVICSVKPDQSMKDDSMIMFEQMNWTNNSAVTPLSGYTASKKQTSRSGTHRSAVTPLSGHLAHAADTPLITQLLCTKAASHHNELVHPHVLSRSKLAATQLPV